MNIQPKFNTETRSEKRKLKRWVKISLSGLIGAALIFGLFTAGGWIVSAMFGSGVRDTGEGETLDKVAEYREEGKTVSLNWDEAEVMAVMHKMTHQKIEASQKWGAIEMTPERVEELLNILPGSNFEHEETLRTILEKWQDGNFSSIASDHNTLWSLQGGTVGKATGKLSEEEEKQFIEETFR